MRMLFLCRNREAAELLAKGMAKSLGQVDIYARHVDFVKVQLQDLTCIFATFNNESIIRQSWDMIWREDVVQPA